MTKTKIIIIAVCIILIIMLLNRKRMMQSVKGDIMKKSYFSIDELCQSSTAELNHIDNTPDEVAKANMQVLIDNVLDPVREKYGSYIKVNSGFRSAALNAKVGGAATSQHTKGEAADITGGSIANNRKIFQTIAELGIYDQLIWEKNGKWVHVSYRQGINRLAMLNEINGSYQNINKTWENVVLV